MNTFTIVTGILGIIGLFSGYKDSIPGYSNYIINSSYISLGLCMGLIFIFLQKSKQKIYHLSSKHIFVYLYFIFFGLLLVLVLIRFPENFLTTLGSVGFFIFFTMNNILNLIRSDSISVSERMLLIKNYESEGNYSKVAQHYSEILDGMNEDDIRYPSTKKKLEESRKKQIS